MKHSTNVGPETNLAPTFTIEVGQGATPVDEGAFSARVAAVLDLGVQAPPAGGKGMPRRQLAVGFELVGATSLGVASDTPPIIYRRYGTSWGAKAELPKFLRAVLGRDPKPGEKLSPVDWAEKAVTVTIEHTTRPDGSVAARIASVTRCTTKDLPGLTATPLLYPGARLDQVPEWAQAVIAGALRPASAADEGGAYNEAA